MERSCQFIITITFTFQPLFYRRFHQATRIVGEVF